MRENLTQAEIEIAFRSTLIQCMSEYGEDVPVLQHYDYLKKGRLGRAVYFTLMNPLNIGYSSRKYNPDQGGLVGHTEHQHMQADVSVTVVADDDPLELALMTKTVMGSLPFVERMREAGLGTQATSNMVTLDVKDDHDNFTKECSFTMPITFNRSLAPATPTVEAASLNIHRV